MRALGRCPWEESRFTPSAIQIRYSLAGDDPATIGTGLGRRLGAVGQQITGVGHLPGLVDDDGVYTRHRID